MKRSYPVAAALLLTALLASCGTAAADSPAVTDANAQSETETAVTEAVTESDAPEADYGGYTFRFLTSEETWGHFSMAAEESTGVTIDDAIWQRNRIVEDALNISITEESMLYTESGDVFTKSVLAGEDAYDAATMFVTSIATYAGDSQLMPLSSLSEICAENPWWNSSAMQDISLTGETYALIGDINLMFYDSHYCVMFNQSIISKYDLENPYDLVSAGTWTIDKMYEMASAASSDVNGNGVVDPDTDNFGMCMHSNVSLSLVSALGGTLFSRDSTGTVVYEGVSDRFVNAYQKACAIYADKAVSVTETSKGISAVPDSYNGVFTSGRGLFLFEVIGTMESLRSMSNEYGVVVMPKYDEDAEYISPVYYNAIGLCVPVTVSDAERTGTVLEYMAKKSYDVVRPAYYDVMLGVKLVRDEKSAESLDVVLSSGRFEISYVYGWGQLATFIQTSVTQNKADIASLVEKKESTILKAMGKTLGE